MTKTKSQKMRKRATISRKGISKKDFNFLNGNTLALNFKGKRNRNGNGVMQRVSAPVAKSFKGGTSRAKITQNGSGVTQVKHSEYVTDVDGSMEFAVDAMPINPGTSTLFPWLSSIANRYESYCFKKLCFRYETTSPTNTPGSVILAVDYNPQAVPPMSKTQALAMESSVRSPPWTSVLHNSLNHNLTKRKSYYIRTDSEVTDPDLYDTGVLMLMSEGVPTESGSIGEMHVDYIVDLITPTLSNTSASGPSNLITASSNVDPADFAYLTEEDIDYDPDTQDFLVGPHLNVDRTVGAVGNVGAMLIRTPGTYIITHMFKSNGLTLPASVSNWTIGIADVEGSSFDVSSFVNVVPGGTDVVVIDSNTNTVTSTNIVQAIGRGSLGTLFGIGSTLDRTVGESGSVQTSIMIAPYYQQVSQSLTTSRMLKSEREGTGKVFRALVHQKEPKILKQLRENRKDERGRQHKTYEADIKDLTDKFKILLARVAATEGNTPSVVPKRSVSKERDPFR